MTVPGSASSARGAEHAHRLAAVWFADLAGYTDLAARNEEAALAAVAGFQDAARASVEAGGGRIVKFVGDGALAEFSSARDAVEAALAMGPRLAERLRVDRAHGRCEVRVGVHLGEVVVGADGDLYGDGVNVAARIQAEARPGCVVVSEDVARQLRARRELAFEPLGERRPRGLPEPIRLFKARRAGTETVAPLTPGNGRPSIAVLPFANLSPDPAHEYFSDGVTEEIVTALARVGGLKVISRTTAMRYKNTTRSIRQIGEELRVSTILEGSVRRDGDRVRITAQLIDTTSDEHLWAERYDRDLEDIFAIQSDVAERIAEALRGRLSPHERSRVAEKAPTRIDAYQRYLKGLHFWNRRTLEGIRRAITEFEAAVALDPAYAPAHAGIGGAYVMMTTWDPDEAADTLHRAREAAERALALDPELGIGYAIRGQVCQREWSWEPAERDLERALEHAPGDATARQWYAHHLAAMGRFDAARREVAQAVEMDPLSLPVLTEEANIELYARSYEEAIARYCHALEIDPWFLPARGLLGNLYHHLERHAEALEQWLEAGLFDIADMAREEITGLSDGMLERALELSREAGAPPSYLALMCSVHGRLERAFAYLEQAVAIRDWSLPTVAVNPLFDPLRGDSRFLALIERMGLAPVARAIAAS